MENAVKNLATLNPASRRVFDARLMLLPLTVVDPPSQITLAPSESPITVLMMLFSPMFTPVTATPVVESRAMLLSKIPAVVDHFLEERPIAFLATATEFPPTLDSTCISPNSLMVPAFRVILSAVMVMSLLAWPSPVLFFSLTLVASIFMSPFAAVILMSPPEFTLRTPFSLPQKSLMCISPSPMILPARVSTS